MSNRWFGARRRPGMVDVRRRWRDDRETSDRVLWGLVGINVVVFALWQFAMWASAPMAELLMAGNFLVSAEAIVHLRVWTLLTYGFSHIDPTHLIFNLIGLWVFGRAVADTYGWRDLLNLYLVGAVAAGAGHVGYQLLTGDPGPALGASGAVMALAAVFGATFPNRTLMINFLFPVPAAIAVAGYILLDVLGVFGVGGGTIAHAAHLGGAAYGLLFWWWRGRPNRD
jgi:membrane associated rhomboid family serine protease